MRAGVWSLRRAAVQQHCLDEVLHLSCLSKQRVPHPGSGVGVGAMEGLDTMVSHTGSTGGAPNSAWVWGQAS
jgi:hypothetical protein